MSVEFALSDCGLDYQQWNGLLGEWAEAQEDDLYDIPEFDTSDEEESTILIWGQGSVRGVVLRAEKGGKKVTARLNVLASRKDWERGFEILKRGLAKGGGTVERETGEKYTVEQLTCEKARQEAVKDFLFGAKSASATLSKSDTDRALLPLAGFALPITSGDLPACTEENQADVETALAQRVEKYGRSFRGHVFVMKDGKRITTWALVPTIIGKVDYVAIDWNEICIPHERLLEILGDRVEPLGDDAWFLPELDRDRDRSVLEELEKGHVDLKTVPPRGEGEGEIDAEGEAQLKQLVKQITLLLMASVLQGGEPGDVKEKLVEAGLAPGLADAITGAAAMALKAVIEEKQEPKAVVQHLANKGVPVPLAIAIVEGVGEGLQKGDEAKDDEAK